MPCVFCEIAAHRAPASVVYSDDWIIAFMTLHPTHPGECLVIPREHVDHFTDIPDALAGQLMIVAQHIGRRMRIAYSPLRVGMVVHGFGVPHAHLIIVPQHSTDDITSGRFARIHDGRIVFDLDRSACPTRTELDAHAALLREQ